MTIPGAATTWLFALVVLAACDGRRGIVLGSQLDASNHSPPSSEPDGSTLPGSPSCLSRLNHDEQDDLLHMHAVVSAGQTVSMYFDISRKLCPLPLGVDVKLCSSGVATAGIFYDDRLDGPDDDTIPLVTLDLEAEKVATWELYPQSFRLDVTGQPQKGAKSSQ